MSNITIPPTSVQQAITPPNVTNFKKKSLKKVLTNKKIYIDKEPVRVSFGSFMKSCVKKKSKLELEQKRLKEKEKQYKISKGMMEEESLPGERKSPQLTTSEALNLQVSKFETPFEEDNHESSNRSTFLGTISQNKSRHIQEFLRSKSRLSSPHGGNIYFSSLIVDELEGTTKSRKVSNYPLDNSDSHSHLSRVSIQKKEQLKSPNTVSANNKKISNCLDLINEAANEESQKKDEDASKKRVQSHNDDLSRSNMTLNNGILFDSFIAARNSKREESFKGNILEGLDYEKNQVSAPRFTLDDAENVDERAIETALVKLTDNLKERVSEK